MYSKYFSVMELLELSRQLKQEQLFVSAERLQIHNLFEEAKKVAEDLYHESWIVRQQRACLEQLQFSSNQTTPKECYSQTNSLEFTNFVDSYKHLSYHESKYGEFLKFLRDNHYLLASLIDCAEKNSQETLRKFILLLVCSVFGNVVFQEDEISLIQVTKDLMELQLATSDNPRVLLRKVNCAFSVTLKLLYDSLYSAKLFLTAALHEPVMRLLMEDEWFYDIDPQKALHRFPPQERARRFGEPGSPDHVNKCSEYRKFIVDKLVVLSNRFISSLRNNMHCFPSNLAWLISQVYQSLMKTGRHDSNKVRAVCADMVFSLFICPAIIDPDPHGITSNIHISHIARHNLMQISQIIQVLAVSHWEEESKEKDLYERFEKGCISSLLDIILESVGTDLPLASLPNNSQMLNISRSSVLIALPQLNFLVSSVRSLTPGLNDGVNEKKQLEEILARIPTLLNCALSPSLQPSGTTPPGTPSTKDKKSRSNKGKKRGIVEDSPIQNDGDSPGEEILVIPLNTDSECPGMMSEQKVLALEQENRPRRVKLHDVPNYDAADGAKRTRFSLSQDQESIGNTSDIQEAISEAASSHSVGSVDLEEDEDRDDMSDMISANVSGRGTPNISGRDTPLSQAGSVEEAPPPQMPIPEIPPLPQTVSKPNRVDVTERFGKFEIRTEIERVETKSTVSDTWSTDVLASDSEPPEPSQYDRLEELVRSSLLARQDHVSEVSETASDAWSTDVLASDTEDKQALSEFDQDDVGSVTDLASIMSGDTGNSENVDGRHSPTEDLHIGGEMEASGGQDLLASFQNTSKPKTQSRKTPKTHSDNVFLEDDFSNLSDTNRLSLPAPKPARPLSGRVRSAGHLLSVPEHSSSQKPGTHQVGQNKPPALLHSDKFSPILQPEKVAPSQPERFPLFAQPLQPDKSSQSLSQPLQLEKTSQSLLQPVQSEKTAPVMQPEKSLSNLQPFPSSGSQFLQPDKLSQSTQFPHPMQRNSHPVPLTQPLQPERFSLPGRLDGNTLQPEKLQNEDQELISLGNQELLAAEKPGEMLKMLEPFNHSSPKQHVNQDANSSADGLGFVAFENPVYHDLKSAERVISCPAISQSKKEFNMAEEGNKKARSAIVWGTTYSSSDSGFGGTPQSIESQSFESLIDTTTNVKLSEQQNANFNTKRLSVALTMFDPVSTEGIESSGNLIDIDEEKLDFKGDKDSWIDDSKTNGAKSESVNSFNIKSPKTSKGIGNENGEISSSRPRRDSSNSSNSSESDGVPFAKSSRSASFDNISERSLEKETAGSITEGKSQKEKREPKGFFKSLRAKVNKVKKKPTKADVEDNDVSNSSLLNDSQMEASAEVDSNTTESTEDILEKYRPKPAGILSNTHHQEETHPCAMPAVDVMKEKRMSVRDEDISGPPLYDPLNQDSCFAFSDTKRKLRIVLSNADIQLGYNLLDFSTSQPAQISADKKGPNEIYKMLRGQLAEALNLQDKDVIAQLHEAIRCVRQFDSNGCKKLIRSLQEDYQSRSAYISYLIRCRQGVLATHSHLKRLLSRIVRDKQICSNHMTHICVKLFIEKKEGNVVRFISDFQKLTVSDEKTDLVERFLQFLYQAMLQDSVWQAANEVQIEDAQQAIERYIMSRIYTHAMFPNGDGDILRDQLFHEHIKKLSQIITPSHKDLRIPRMYQFECPWTAAQKEIYNINAYKTPKDKVKCVFQCSTTIMNLLSMANEKAVPAADDFMPVLIFVVIKANPPCMLSTVQYVNSFYEDRIGGEEQYWWMQFCAAVEFIKNMEYTNE